MTEDKKDFSDVKGKLLRIPLSMRGWPKWLVWAFSAVGLLYILNPTLGVIELLPDNLPLIGNLDEGAAYLLVYYGIMEFLAPYINQDLAADDDDDVIDAEWSDGES